MKHLKLFFALFAMLALGVGNAWAEASFTIKFKDNGSDASTALTATTFTKQVAEGADLIKSVSTSYCYPGTGGLKCSSNNNNGTFTLTLNNSYTISKIVLNVKNKNATTKTVKVGSTSFSTSDSWNTTSFEDMVFSGTETTSDQITVSLAGSAKSKRVAYIASMTVYYKTDEPGTEEPALSATPTEIDFGTVYQGTTVADKTVAVNFANLTGAVTYSGLSTPFSATGAISATGDKITILADASTIGAYSQTLTIASTADSKTAEVTVKMNVVEKPAPTGTFTLHTGELIEGDYVIYYSGKAMKAEVASDRLQYVEVTPSNNEIVDPAAAAIWHIAKSGANWTVYNNNKGYAAGTGTKSEAGLVANLTGDNANKAAWTVTASGNAYEFVNVWNKSKSVNANLRNNTTYGFACYATSTGGALSLYRKAGTKYNVTVSSTTNGSVTANPTSAEAGTTITLTVTPAGGYVLDALTVTDASSNPVTATDNKFTMPASDVTVTATFKENEKPAATLTLSKNGVAETFPGSWKQDDVVTLPSITSDCVKEFVGWSANPTCNVAPEYKAGDEYTLAETAQTLYAVYADGESGEVVTQTLTITDQTTNSTYGNNSFTDNKGGVWSGQSNIPDATHFGLRQNDDNTHMASPVFPNNIINITAKIRNQSQSGRKVYLCSNNTTAKPSSGDLGGVNVNGSVTDIEHTFTLNGTFNQFYIYTNGALQFNEIEVTYSSAPTYSNYSTTCAAAPIATVDPTSVTATVAAGNGKVEVTYENVNTENVSVALYNDEACTGTFTAGWLTASIDADKNIAYTVAENTTYAERKAYIQLTAPEITGATDPAVVVIPVTQAAKDKVFVSLEELVAADLTAGDEVSVTLNNDVIKDFYIYSSKRCGVVFDVQKDGKDIKIYFNNQTTIDDWAVGGKLSGTLTNVKWTTYSSAWQLAPANTWAWANLTYTEPKAVSTVVVSGAPTKTTYVDGEAFDPAGLTVTVNYNDATSEVNPTGVTFAVTPATLVKDQTSVSVTATFNSVTSAAYEVTGLTVNDIPTKTVAEFIAAEGGRCYLEGIVSGLTEGNSMKYGNFDLTDASGTIYVYGCLNAAGESQKFAALGVKNGDKIKVIADEYELYGGTKDEAIDVQYVSHISAATITIADITMEVGETKAIAATVDPADAVVTYTIKENEANAISLLEGNTIKALAEGTATITATVAEGATYLGNSVDFTVTVGPKTESDEVVILAEHNGQWYALKAEDLTGENKILAALEVTYFNETLYNVNEGDKASITWTRTVIGDQVTFKNGTNYLYVANPSKTELSLNATAFSWTYDAVLDTYTSNNGARTFLYSSEANGFKNFAINNNVGTKNYSGYPVVTAPVYATGDVVYTRTVTNGNYGTLCIPFGSNVGNYSGAEFYEVSWLSGEGLYLDELAADAPLVAGKPYIFRATSTEIKVTCTGDAVAAPVEGENGLTGTFTDIATGDAALDGNYIIAQNRIWVAGANNSLPANRAYINKDDVPTTEQPKLPGRRRVCMGENAETGVDNIITTDAPVKVIENGQLIIIRNGEKFNVQGQKL